MHTRIAKYTFTGDAEELARRAEEGMLPIFKRQSGFLAYGVMLQGDRVISMSAWNSESDAKSADEAAKDWVAKNADMTVLDSFIGDYAWLEFVQQ